jgi:ABC-type multidrug transport system permease subunit
MRGPLVWPAAYTNCVLPQHESRPLELNMSNWTWPAIVQLWIGALTASILLVAIQLFVLYRRVVARNTKVLWLLQWRYVVPSATFVLTLYWALTR